MEQKEAFEVVRQLIDGIDPRSGAKLPDDSAYNHPHIIRALVRVADLAAKAKPALSIDERRRRNAERGLPQNTGLPWEEEARAAVASGFCQGISVEQLAESLKRTRSAILAELQRQGVITTEKAAELGLSGLRYSGGFLRAIP